jgi:hypothetical protein
VNAWGAFNVVSRPVKTLLSAELIVKLKLFPGAAPRDVRSVCFV